MNYGNGSAPCAARLLMNLIIICIIYQGIDMRYDFLLDNSVSYAQ
jgi:hypothetical protein